MRGALTAEARYVAISRLDWDINTEQLRLLPYIQYLLMNDQGLEPSRISAEERPILAMFRERGWLEGGASRKLKVTKEFWDAMNEILWLTYVNY
jgi:hypothetical protein